MIIPDGFAQVNMIFSGVGLPTGAQVVFGVDPSDPVAETPSSVANKVNIAWTSATMKTLYSGNIIHSGTLVKFGPNLTGPSGLFPGTGAGTAGNEMTPPNTALLVQKITDFGGRAGKGRMYLPFVQEPSVNSAGDLTAGFVTATQALLTNWRNLLEAADVEMVLLHGDQGGPITEPLKVTTLTLQGRVATQRRRLRR